VARLSPEQAKYLLETGAARTLRADEQIIKGMAAEAGVPYQSLINLYLRDCLAQNRKVEIKWPSAV
jgi:predicted DNA binding CopG/RHH family protein